MKYFVYSTIIALMVVVIAPAAVVDAAAGCDLVVQLYNTATNKAVDTSSKLVIYTGDYAKYGLRVEGTGAECAKAFVQANYSTLQNGRKTLTREMYAATELKKVGSVYRVDKQFGQPLAVEYSYEASQMARVNINQFKVLQTLPALTVAFSDDKTIAGKPVASAGAGQSIVDNDAIDPIDSPVEAKTLPGLLLQLIRYALSIIALVAIVMILIAGFRMIIGSGDERQRTAAKRTITWAILGLILALMAVSIVTIVQQVIRP